MKKQLDYKDYLEGTRKILKESEVEKESYKTEVAGREFVVYPSVFSPKYFKDTEVFADNLPVFGGEEMLEIGPGTGAVSIMALHRGAGRVVAIDVNPAAVRNTKENIELHDMNDKMEVRQGDVFDALDEDEKFDVIFWNTPFGLVDDEELSDLERSVYDHGYKATEKFVMGAKKHLDPGGRVLIGFSSTLGRLDLLEEFTMKAGLSLKLLYEEDSDEVHPVKFEIFVAKPV